MSKSSSSACLRCNETHILIEAPSNSWYSEASICECFVMPCISCHGARFVLERDALNREVAIPCPRCETLKRHILLYNAARIPKRYVESRLAPGDMDADNRNVYLLMKAILRDLSPARETTTDHEDLEELKGMMLMGGAGTGKTHLMTGFAYQCTINLGINCVFQGFSELLSELKKGYTDGKSDIEIIDPHLKADVLIIDDLGKGRNSPWELQILDTLICERYNRNKIIMATTNYTEDEETTLKERILTKDTTDIERFQDDTIRKRVGERIYSRLRQMCYFEYLGGKDRRQVE
ncbi:ATP-binding protein [Deltaproteobacteria bacterium TL4]